MVNKAKMCEGALHAEAGVGLGARPGQMAAAGREGVVVTVRDGEERGWSSTRTARKTGEARRGGKTRERVDDAEQRAFGSALNLGYPRRCPCLPIYGKEHPRSPRMATWPLENSVHLVPPLSAGSSTSRPVSVRSRAAVALAGLGVDDG